MNYNQPPPVSLEEQHYPNVLRTDGAASTYVDNAGNTFIEPLLDHDYAMTQLLVDEGLTSGRIVTVEGHQPLIGFDHNTDLLPLTSVLNSSLSLENPGGIDDVEYAIYLIAKSLKVLNQKSQIVPADCNMAMWAIDRPNDRAELIPPYQASPSGGSPLVAIDQLKADVLGNNPSQELSNTVEDLFEQVLDNLHLNHE